MAIVCWKFDAVLLVGSLFMAGCGGGKPPEEGKPTGVTCPTMQTLTYANFGKAFMDANCVRCHSSKLTGAARKGAPDDHNFDTAEDIRPLTEHIDELAGAGATITNTAMPPDEPRPGVEDRRRLAEWLACGAP